MLLCAMILDEERDIMSSQAMEPVSPLQMFVAMGLVIFGGLFFASNFAFTDLVSKLPCFIGGVAAVGGIVFLVRNHRNCN